MTIALCQIRPRLGDVSHNLELALAEIKNHGDNIIVFPELFLLGYPPTDDMLISGVCEEITNAIDALLKISRKKSGLVVMGAPVFDGKHWKNAALAIANGKIIHQHHKMCLPNYDVFNDARYFTPGDQAVGFNWKGERLALLICEDIWANIQAYPIDPVMQLVGQGISTVIHLTASPFETCKLDQRIQQLRRVSSLTKSRVVSVNQVGGYSDILFDGQSIGVNAEGDLMNVWPAFKPVIGEMSFVKKEMIKKTVEDQIIEAISFGLKEYMEHAGFDSVVVGLSGGIDSALVAALAVHALGPKHVMLVALPTKYNTNETKQDAIEMAKRLGSELVTIPIEMERQVFENKVLSLGKGVREITKQNIQARLRGLFLMAISNETGALLLTTGNKSELAMGYATLYGDRCGGLNIIGDCFKTEVIKLAQAINEKYDWIPEGVIARPPSAELAPNQTDEDTLPPYETLDQILYQRMIEGFSLNQLLELNDKNDVAFVLERLKMNEYKRGQSPPILKVSTKSFGRGWQYPLIR